MSYGITRLMRGSREVSEARCEPPGACQESYVDEFDPPFRAREGSTLSYEFTCIDNPDTVDVDECNDPNPDGSTIQIDYEVVRGP